MRKFIDGYYRLLNWLLVATVAILIVPVSLQIFSRFTALIPSYIWTEEMARFFFIWMIMIGAMVGIRDSAHFDVDLWPELEPRANALLRIVSNVFVLVLALVFLWYGIKFVQFGWSQNSELAELPMPFIFAAWPLAGLTWMLFLGEKFLRRPAHLARCPRERAMSSGGAALSPAVAALILFGVFFRLMALRVPIAFALGLACLPILIIEPRLSPLVLFNQTFKSYNSFILLAVPFFLLTANLMNVGGITDRLVQAVARPGRPPARRPRAGQRRAVDLLRRHLRLVDGRRREPGQDLHRGAGQGRLRPVVLGRDHRGVGGARRDHPAVDPDDRVGRHADRVDRRAVPRRHHSGTAARLRADGHRPRLREAAQLPQVPALER